MEAHIEREIRLIQESKLDGLYSWSLQEFNEEGEKIGSDQIPWSWGLIFTASELRHHQWIEIESIADDEEDDDEPVKESESIRGILHPGICRDGESLEDDTSYSMFGTDRRIKQFSLLISKLGEGDENDRCKLWGCVSHTAETDFRIDTEDDTVEISLWLTPKRFNKLVEIIKAQRADIVEVGLRSVSGFYSEWSPSISTNAIKILAPVPEYGGGGQEIIRPDNCEIDSPRLGEVGQFSIGIGQRNIINPKQDLGGANIDKLFEESDDYVEEDDEQEASESQPDVSGQLLAQLARNELTLSKLRIPLWLIFIVLLFLLFTLVL